MAADPNQTTPTDADVDAFLIGRSCLYITRLDRVDTDVLREMVAASFNTRHPSEI